MPIRADLVAAGIGDLFLHVENLEYPFASGHCTLQNDEALRYFHDLLVELSNQVDEGDNHAERYHAG